MMHPGTCTLWVLFIVPSMLNVMATKSGTPPRSNTSEFGDSGAGAVTSETISAQAKSALDKIRMDINPERPKSDAAHDAGQTPGKSVASQEISTTSDLQALISLLSGQDAEGKAAPLTHQSTMYRFVDMAERSGFTFILGALLTQINSHRALHCTGNLHEKADKDGK